MLFLFHLSMIKVSHINGLVKLLVSLPNGVVLRFFQSQKLILHINSFFIFDFYYLVDHYSSVVKSTELLSINSSIKYICTFFQLNGINFCVFLALKQFWMQWTFWLSNWRRNKCNGIFYNVSPYYHSFCNRCIDIGLGTRCRLYVLNSYVFWNYLHRRSKSYKNRSMDAGILRYLIHQHLLSLGADSAEPEYTVFVIREYKFSSRGRYRRELSYVIILSAFLRKRYYRISYHFYKDFH